MGVKVNGCILLSLWSLEPGMCNSDWGLRRLGFKGMSVQGLSIFVPVLDGYQWFARARNSVCLATLSLNGKKGKSGGDLTVTFHFACTGRDPLLLEFSSKVAKERNASLRA